MPKTEIDYSNTIIYKITCKDPGVTAVYVGHTTNFVQRKHAHKQGCINNKSANYKCKLYEMIRNNSGWDNWNMEIVNFFNCKDHYEARKKEQEYFILLNATLNSIEPLPLAKPKNPTIKVNESKEKKIFYCEKCKIHCNTSDLLEKHYNTKKHNNIKKYNLNILEETVEKTPLFVCKICDFKCSKQNDFKRHTETNKHKRVTESNKKTPNKVEQTFSCICGNIYKYRPGLAKHKRTCDIVNAPEVFSMSIKYDNKNVLYEENKDKEKKTYTLIEDNICSDNNIVITKNMFMELINDNKEMMKIIKGQQEQINSIIPKLGNITNNNNTTMNNNFNLNVFLNEQCKDALNISDFIDSLKITLEDLLFSKTNGISRGITDVLIKGLKELDIYKRPIHCTDIKRDIMYIKDEDKWQKDENHDMMKNTIVKIAYKERTALQQWAIDNPDWMDTEKKQIQYLTMMRSVCEPIENYNNYERKIIKNIGKEILIDKKM